MNAYAIEAELIDGPSIAAERAPPSFDDFPELFGDPPRDAPTRFDIFARNGFMPLLQPAGHPSWPLSPKSTIRSEDLAKTPAVLGRDGLARGLRDWTKLPSATEKDVQQWQQMGCPDKPANVSLRMGEVAGASLACGAIDVDVDCPALAPNIIDLARRYFGISPRRTRLNSPRALMLYRLAHDAARLGKKRVAFEDKDGRKHAVEILLHGNQCIVTGVHKSGAAYGWPDSYPVAGELPEIGVADIEQFMNALCGDGGLLQQEGCTLTGKSAQPKGSSRRYPIGYKLFLAPSLDKLREALAGFPNTVENAPDRADLLQITIATKAACGGDEDFYPDFEEWAMAYDGNTPDYVRKMWDSIHDAAIGWDWLWRHTGYGTERFPGGASSESTSSESTASGGGTASSSSDEWEAPTDFWVDDAAPVDLPTGVVPAIIEGVARDHALRLGVEAGSPAAGLITSLGSLVHAGNRLQMRQNDTGWTVRPILWTAIIADSGTNKTAMLGYALDAARSVDTKLKQEYALALHKFNAQHQMAKKKSKAEHFEQPCEPQTTTDIVFEPEKPRFRQKIINNATTEAIAAILADNPSGVLSFRDELSGFFGAMDTYRAKGGVDRPFWLEAKDGGHYTVNRRTSDPILVENLAVSVLGAIQPEKFRNICEGLTDDGLLQRFTPIFLRRTGIGEDVAPNQSLADSLAKIASTLIEDNEPRRYRFAPDADRELRAHQAFVAHEVAQPDALPAFRQWLNKSVNEFGRLSLVFHLLEYHSSPERMIIDGAPPELVSVETAQRARRYLMEFVYPHARMFYRCVLGSSPIETHAKWVADFILSRGMSSIRNRDVYKNYAAFKKSDKRKELADTMHHLHMQDWIRPANQTNSGPTKWTVNPIVHVQFADRTAREQVRRESVRENIRRDAEFRRAQ